VTRTSCQFKATSDLLLRQPLAAVLTLGDEQYEEGYLKAFYREYAPTWGRVKSITHPTPGDHETFCDCDGYYQYFGAAAGSSRVPYYSFDIGAWHLISLDSNCEEVDGCRKGSRQEKWLAADLRRSKARCTLAFFHEPLFSSGGHGDDFHYRTLWEDLYAAHADVVLNGHDHVYERFAPQDPMGRADANGIREFVVGTGGKNHGSFRVIRANSQVRAAPFGVLELTLHPRSYNWRFVSIAGSAFTDSGSSQCH
jgi:hypothetical protein